MLDARVLELLRCPIDPQREARIVCAEDGKLRCARCQVRFLSREGIPILVADEAVLPDSCQRLQDLPCRHTK
jgi:uncharacterized protein YbaR (Trm112 family)